MSPTVEDIQSGLKDESTISLLHIGGVVRSEGFIALLQRKIGRDNVVHDRRAVIIKGDIDKIIWHCFTLVGGSGKLGGGGL